MKKTNSLLKAGVSLLLAIMFLLTACNIENIPVDTPNIDSSENSNEQSPTNDSTDPHTSDSDVNSSKNDQDDESSANVPEQLPPKSDSGEQNAQTYTITYRNASNHNNPTFYTSSDNITLMRPYWPGLSFSHWTDEDGNSITEIPKGTTGNLVLTANWKYTENIAVSNESNNILFAFYSEEDNRYYFVYNIGSMHNVVLDELSSYRYNGATNHTWSIAETVSFTESNAQSVAKTVSKAVTSSSSWNKTTEDAAHISASESGSVGLSVSGKIGNENLAQIGAELNVNKTAGLEGGTSSTTSESSSSSSSSSSETSKTVSSTISFVTDTTTEIVRSETLEPSLSPAGLYKYVQAGSINVYAIISYDIDTKNYFINIYSYIDQTYETMLYEPIPEYNSDLNIVDSEPFKFDLDIDALANDIIGNAYYVEFDANGGSGTMPKQMMLPNSITALYRNQYIFSGYNFVGWKVANSDTTIVYTDGQKVNDLASAKGTVKLEAIWSRNADVDTVYSLKTKTGTVSSLPKITYSAEIEYRNRTAESVEIRVRWTSTISAGYYTVYGQNFKFDIGSVSSGTVKVASFNTWRSASSSNRSKTAESGWITIPLSTQDETTIDLSIYYWQTNSNNLDMYKYDGTDCVKKTWQFVIPACY